MKYRIYNPKNKQDITEFKLVQRGNNLVLVSVDNDGDLDWNILEITSEGYLSLYEAIDKDTGLKLDTKGRIKREVKK